MSQPSKHVRLQRLVDQIRKLQLEEGVNDAHFGRAVTSLRRIQQRWGQTDRLADERVLNRLAAIRRQRSAQ